jgi:hypothetical protein
MTESTFFLWINLCIIKIFPLPPNCTLRKARILRTLHSVMRAYEHHDADAHVRTLASSEMRDTL